VDQRYSTVLDCGIKYATAKTIELTADDVGRYGVVAGDGAVGQEQVASVGDAAANSGGIAGDSALVQNRRPLASDPAAATTWQICEVMRDGAVSQVHRA
jgi:hypothetical protein